MSYSQVDLLEEERFLLSEEASWKDRMMYKLLNTKKVPLDIRIPSTYLSRATVFCEDLMRITDDEFNIEPATLIDLLVQDFIYELARTHSGPLAPFEYLLDKYSKILKVAHYQSSKVEEFELYKKPTEPMKMIRVKVDRKEVLRLEWFLSDLELEVEEHGLTVERIMEILFCYLVDLVKKGEAEKAVKRIITSIQKMK